LRQGGRIRAAGVGGVAAVNGRDGVRRGGELGGARQVSGLAGCRSEFRYQRDDSVIEGNGFAADIFPRPRFGPDGRSESDRASISRGAAAGGQSQRGGDGAAGGLRLHDRGMSAEDAQLNRTLQDAVGAVHVGFLVHQKALHRMF